MSEEFATYLKEAREAAGLNQSELAEQVGLTGSYISVLESRKKPPPSDTVLRRLAGALGRPELEMLEVAHLARAPDDLRKKIRALDRRLSLERRVTHRLLTDVVPGSLWHFWHVRGYSEYGLEKLRLDGRKARILRKVLRRIGHLTSREDFLEESRIVIEALPVDERTVLAEALPELTETPSEPAEAAPSGTAPVIEIPVYDAPPGRRRKAAPARTIPVSPAEFRPDAYFLLAADDDMLPRVEQGDLLLVDPHAELRPGDVVVRRRRGGFLLRQVLAVKDALLLGAANPRIAPEETRPAQVAGVVLEIRRRLR